MMICRLVRFTPAYAGNTVDRFRLLSTEKVHPRIRGEYYCGKKRQAGPVGSPPHTRGIQRLPFCHRHDHGFTPAYAGNTINVPQGEHPA